MKLGTFLYTALTALVGTGFLHVALDNLASHFTFSGRHGARLRYELDHIKGGLLGVPHYSIVEATCALLCTTLVAGGALHADSNRSAFRAALAMLVGFLYVFTGTTYVGLLASGMDILSERPDLQLLTAARVLGFAFGTTLFHVGWWDAIAVVPAIGITALAIIAVSSRMRERESECEARIDRYRKIMEFCKREDWSWKPGADAPEGFETSTDVPDDPEGPVVVNAESALQP